MPEQLVIYTAIMGRIRDDCGRTLVPKGLKLDEDTRVVLITDRDIARDFEPVKAGRWELMEPIWTHPNGRRAARYHKLHSHLLFPDAPLSIWFDGSQQLTTNPRGIFERHLPNTDIAAFKHPDRTCVYQEHRACVLLRKDNPKVMQGQINKYKADNYPPFNGMVETTVLCRRNTPDVARFNELWWNEIEKGSLRDQLSFNYVAWKLSMGYSHIPGRRDKSPYCRFYPHK